MVAFAAVALVPTVTDRLGRHVWPGLAPTGATFSTSPSSLHQTNPLDMT